MNLEPVGPACVKDSLSVTVGGGTARRGPSSSDARGVTCGGTDTSLPALIS